MKKLVLFIMVLFLLVGCDDNEHQPLKYQLPDLSNKTQEEANNILEHAPITIIHKDKASDEIEDGLFIEYGHNLKASDLVDYGSVIYIYFSEKEIEQLTITLPDLKGKNYSEIISIMNAYEVNIFYNFLDNETIENNLFIGYGKNLEVGSEVSKDDNVIINISKEYVILPSLSEKTLDEIEIIMNDYDNLLINYEYVENNQVSDDLFYRYGNNLSSGSKVYVNTHITIQISKYKEQTNPYFMPIDFIYDGPRLDAKYTGIDPVDPRGGYFIVPLTGCTDGDTAFFDYPNYIDVELDGYKGTRFLNMDTEETFSGGEEEWGKPASIYTCSLLQGAESIIIQTDPGDNLTGNYGRLLGWIWIVPDGTNVKDGEATYTIDQYELLNYKVVQQGLAQVKYLYGAGAITYQDISYTDWMYQAQNYAKSNQLGQWGTLLDPYWNYEIDEPKGW